MHRPNVGPSCHARKARYQRELEVYRACQACQSAKSDLRSAERQTEAAQSGLSRSQSRVTQLRQELSSKKQELSQWQAKYPGLKSAKEAMDAEWLPQQAECAKTHTAYINGKQTAVIECAPTFYDDSCEKACIELQASVTGCGVVEGGDPDDVAGLGGVEVTCAPPQPSWILGPFTYGAREPAGEQCKRIEARQSAYHAQKILKSGWLWKKGRLGGWEERYVVLESGTKVRSAVLRYWDKDPTKTNDTHERTHKGILLRDAKGVKEKDGKHYGRKNGEECFKLYHFYRDYRFCVFWVTSAADDKADELVSRSELIERERDEWVKLIEDAIVG